MDNSEAGESTMPVNTPPEPVNATRILGARVTADVFNAFRLVAARNNRTVSEHLRVVAQREVDQAA